MAEEDGSESEEDELKPRGGSPLSTFPTKKAQLNEVNVVFKDQKKFQTGSRSTTKILI